MQVSVWTGRPLRTNLCPALTTGTRSCGRTRNRQRWEPSLVILRINRGALDAKWSNYGKKFAVASGAKCGSFATMRRPTTGGFRK